MRWSTNLKMTKLKSDGRVGQDFGSVTECPSGVLLSVGGDDFGSSFTRGFSFGSHDSGEILRQANIFHFDTLDFDAPMLGALVENLLNL